VAADDPRSMYHRTVAWALIMVAWTFLPAQLTALVRVLGISRP
jgi:hypothetical protein